VNLQAEFEEYQRVTKEDPALAAPDPLVTALEDDRGLAPAFAGHLTWDDRQAAHERRVDQARHLIGRFEVMAIVVDRNGAERTESVRAVIAVPEKTGRGETVEYVWRQRDEVIQDEDRRARALDAFRDRVLGNARSYRDLGGNLDELARLVTEL
jgi:hypothetical protein